MERRIRLHRVASLATREHVISSDSGSLILTRQNGAAKASR